MIKMAKSTTIARKYSYYCKQCYRKISYKEILENKSVCPKCRSRDILVITLKGD